jgi:hypothetical protein
LVEHDLAKVGVASSSLVSRSKHYEKATQTSGFFLPAIYRVGGSTSFFFTSNSIEVHGIGTDSDPESCPPIGQPRLPMFCGTQRFCAQATVERFRRGQANVMGNIDREIPF